MKKNIKLLKINRSNSDLFNKYLLSYYKEINKNSKFYLSKKNLHKITKNSNFSNFLILNKKEYCGFIIIQEYENISNKKICLIKDFYISKDFRREKLGITIIKCLIVSLKLKNIRTIRVDILSNNIEAKHFWKNFKLLKQFTSYRINF